MVRPSNRKIQGRINRAKAYKKNRCTLQRCVVRQCRAVIGLPDSEKGVRRCRKKQRYEYCHWHGKSELNVRVGESTVVNGLGLFSTATFKAGETVGFYSGEVLNGKEFKKRYEKKNKVPQYVFKMSENCYIDSQNNRCLMAMINSSRRSNFSANCEFVYDKRNKIIQVRVKKEIKEILINTEFLISYAVGLILQ